MSIFVGRNRKPTIIGKNNFSRLLRVSGAFRRKWSSDLDFTGKTNPEPVFYQSGKFPLSQKFREDNSECHEVTVTMKGLKCPK